MNTPPLSDQQQQHVPPAWMLTFSDGTIVTSDSHAWADFTEPAQVDGVTVYETTRPVSGLTLKDRLGSLHQLQLPPERALYLFAFRRNAVSVFQPPVQQWCYSCFGYTLPTYRVLLFATPTGMQTRVESRLTPFTL